MKLLKVTKKECGIYEIVYTKGIIWKTHHTEDVFFYFFDLRYVKNGKKINYNFSTAVSHVIKGLKNVGDSCIVNKLENEH